MAAEGSARKVWLGIGLLALLIPASDLFHFLTQRSDIWWTPKALAVPLVESTDRVEIYVQGRLLQEQLGAQRLQVLTDRGPTALGVGDVKLRFNNRDRVRAGEIPTLLGSAFVIGVGGVIVLLSVLGMLPTRPPRPQGQPGE